MKSCCNYCNLPVMIIALFAMMLSIGPLQAQTAPTCNKAVKEVSCSKATATTSDSFLQKAFAIFKTDSKMNCDPAECAKICGKKPICNPAECAKICPKTCKPSATTPVKMVNHETTKKSQCSAKKSKAVLATNE